jgi:hypothetical protein
MISGLTTHRQQSFPAQVWIWYSATRNSYRMREHIDAAYGRTDARSRVLIQSLA